MITINIYNTRLPYILAYNIYNCAQIETCHRQKMLFLFKIYTLRKLIIGGWCNKLK